MDRRMGRRERNAHDTEFDEAIDAVDEQAREAKDLREHRGRAERYAEERRDPRHVKRRPHTGTGVRSTATARTKAD